MQTFYARLFAMCRVARHILHTIIMSSERSSEVSVAVLSYVLQFAANLTIVSSLHTQFN